MQANMPAAVGELRMNLSKLPPEYNYMMETLQMPLTPVTVLSEELQILSRRLQVPLPRVTVNRASVPSRSSMPALLSHCRTLSSPSPVFFLLSVFPPFPSRMAPYLTSLQCLSPPL